MSEKCAPKGKKSKYYVAAAALLGYAALAYYSLFPTLPSRQAPFVLYSNQLHSDLKLTTLAALKKAKHSITLQIYGLTDPDVIHLLEKKQRAGVDVTIFHDKKGTKVLPKELQAFPVKCQGLMHRKILVIDGQQIFLGTANYTSQSLKMHDNVILGLYSPELAQFFEEACDEMYRGQLGIRAYLLPSFGKDPLSEVIRIIDGATESIHVAMFTFTHPKIVAALARAQGRGTQVSLAIDRYTLNGASQKSCEILLKAGSTVLKGRGSQLLHHKWALIDGKTFILGSANWTKSAFEKNQDVLIIIDELESQEKKKIQKLWRSLEQSMEKV